MTKTLALRQLIVTKLNTLSGVTYYRIAPNNAAYPYKVFDLGHIELGDSTVDNYQLTIDIWDRATNTKTIDELADNIEALFNNANLPQDDILPTFWRSNRYPVADEDKGLQHLALNFDIQLYENN